MKQPGGLMGMKLQFLYYLWQLAGGDIQAELKKNYLIKNTPPILSMPMYVCYLSCIDTLLHISRIDEAKYEDSNIQLTNLYLKPSKIMSTSIHKPILSERYF